MYIAAPRTTGHIQNGLQHCTHTRIHTHTHYKVLDGDFAPFAAVVQGMEALDLIFKVGEGGASGGPSQQRITSEGNVYLDKEYVGE